jgi:flagellar basal body-associated protein FliL
VTTKNVLSKETLVPLAFVITLLGGTGGAAIWMTNSSNSQRRLEEKQTETNSNILLLTEKVDNLTTSMRDYVTMEFLKTWIDEYARRNPDSDVPPIFR